MRPESEHGQGRASGFTLVELMTVIGLIALLISLFLPVISKVRAAANSAGCASNLRQVGVAWTMYAAENHGRLPTYVGNVSGAPERAYYGYWTGIVDRNGVRDGALLCSAARIESDRPFGYGTVTDAWTGRPARNGSLRLDDRTYRVSSYGYNGYLFAAGGPVRWGKWTRVNDMTDRANVPVFFDCVASDANPENLSETRPAAPPPNLCGDQVSDSSPQHWRFLIGRHGRGINVYMADGSARWVRLDEMLTLTWAADWRPHRTNLPSK